MLTLVAMLLFVVVSCDAVVLNDAQIISACLNDHAHVVHKAIVSNGAELYGNATVCDNARVHGANLFDHVVIQDNAEIGPGSEIFGDITLGSGVKITGYIGRDAVIKTKV